LSAIHQQGTSNAFAQDVPTAAVVAAAVIVAVVVTATIAAAGIAMSCCEWAGVSDAYRLPWLLPDVSIAGLASLAGVILGTISGSDGNAA
jgi:hypothetical protein